MHYYTNSAELKSLLANIPLIIAEDFDEYESGNKYCNNCNNFKL